MNIPTFDCDKAAKTAYENETIKKILADRYHGRVINNNKVDTKYLASIIFANAEEMKFIKSLTDPFVKDEYRKFCISCENLGLSVSAIESATLIGSYFESICKAILVKTTGDDNINIDRAMYRNKNFNEIHYKSILDCQMSDKKMLSNKRSFEIKDYDNFYEEYKNVIDALL